MLDNSKILKQVTTVFRHNHYSLMTEKTYLDWIYRYLFFNSEKSPFELGEKEITQFLNFLSTEKKFSVATQNQAINSLLFLHKKVLKQTKVHFDFKHLKCEKHAPGVFSREEIQAILKQMKDEAFLATALLYGSGLRLHECFELRIKDIDFEHNQIIVQKSKNKDYDRRSLLPIKLIPLLKDQIELSILKWNKNISTKRFSGVFITESLKRKYPSAPMEKAWQYIFPAKKLSIDTRSTALIQQHRLVSFLQKAVKRAGAKAGIMNNASPQTFRHSFATHLLEDGYDIHIVQKLLGHKTMRTTMRYKHGIHQRIIHVRSPIEEIQFF